MKIIDTHIHVGQFYNSYFSPEMLSDFMRKNNIFLSLISSTTTCEKNYLKVINEFYQINKLRVNVIPCLWLTESFLKEDIINKLLQSEIKWGCLKIHPAFSPHEWVPESDSIELLIHMNQELQIPLLIHTGYDECCMANRYEKEIRENPDVNFILAHGRPIDEAIKMALKYNNVYIDTAFMPLEDILSLVHSGLEDKVLWGSDFPIPTYFDNNYHYYSTIKELHNKLSIRQFHKLTFINAFNLFRFSFSNILTPN